MDWLSISFSAALIAATGASMGASGDGHFFTDDANLVVGGYDLVSYFTTNTATLGSGEFETDYEGARFRFASRANLEAFEASPKAYLPQYGGWCAYAMGAKNVKFEVNPKTFKLVDGKLYLFYNGEQGNASVPWNQDEAKLRGQADRHWKTLSAKP